MNIGGGNGVFGWFMTNEVLLLDVLDDPEDLSRFDAILASDDLRIRGDLERSLLEFEQELAEEGFFLFIFLRFSRPMVFVGDRERCFSAGLSFIDWDGFSSSTLGLGPFLFDFLVIEVLGRGSRIPADVVSKGRFWPMARSMGGFLGRFFRDSKILNNNLFIIY